MKKKIDFWGKFDEMMSALPGYIDTTIAGAFEDDDEPKVRHGLFSSVSKTTIVQNGDNITVVKKNGKKTIKVNGKEYVEKV